jgi:VanZ family protein
LRRAWQVLLVVLLGVVTWLALTPLPPQTLSLGWDKLNHLAAFGALAWAAVRGLEAGWWRTAGGLLAYGALIECLQALTPTREAEWADLLSDGLGIGIGLIVAALARRLAQVWLRPSPST